MILLSTPTAIGSIIGQIAIILGIGFVLKLFSDRTGAPLVVILILAGTLFATLGVLDIAAMGPIPDVMRMVALIIVVFANGFYLRLDNISTEGKTSVSLATFGLILTAAMITLAANSFLGLSILPALFLGALLCGTDPAAVSTIMEKFPEKIQSILNMESIMNQPLMVILPLMVFDFVVYQPAIQIALPLYAAKFVLLVGVGLIVGLVGFFAGQKILQMAGLELEEIAGLTVALLSYVIAEALGGSGIVAVGVTSVLLSSSRKVTKQMFMEFNREIALIFTIFVFVMLGMEFPLQMLDILEITRFDFIFVVVAVLSARIVSVWITTYKSGLKTHEKIKLGFIAPRGMSSAALAPLAITMAATSDFMSNWAAFTILKIVYLTIIISALISIIISEFFTPER